MAEDFMASIIREDQKVAGCLRNQAFGAWFQQQQAEVARNQEAVEETQRRWRRQQTLQEVERDMRTQRLQDIQVDAKQQKLVDQGLRAAEHALRESQRATFEMRRGEILQEIQEEELACHARLNRLADKWADHAAKQANVPAEEARHPLTAFQPQRFSPTAAQDPAATETEEAALDQALQEVRQQREMLKQSKQRSKTEQQRLWAEVAVIRVERLQLEIEASEGKHMCNFQPAST